MIGGHILTFLLVLVTATELGNTEGIQVFPVNCSHSEISNCIQITEAMKQLSSGTTLYLLPGQEHVLEEFTLVEGVKNIALIGTHQLDISLTCSKGVGLAFVGVINLTIQHIKVNRCGLSGHNLEKAIFAVDEKVGGFFKVPLSLDIALLIADITNACVKDITVYNTTGIGLLGINLMGSSALINSTFSHNHFEKCVTPSFLYEILGSDYERQIGGGAFLVYHDYKDITNMENYFVQLKVQNSTFLQNKDCSISGSIAQRMQFSEVLRNRGYMVGGGGGLSLILTQKGYSTSINVNSCLFMENAGQFGAGVYLAYFSGCISSVVLSDSQFIGNGKSELTNGGGLSILGDLIRPYGNFSSFNAEYTPTDITIKVVCSNFVENSAFLGGGAFTRFVSGSLDKFLNSSNTTTLSYCNCSFQSNVAEFGAALYIHEYNLVTAAVYSMPVGTLVEVSNIHAKNNTVLHPIRTSTNSSGIIDIRYVHFTLRGNCTLSHNNGTAIRARRSPIHVWNHANFNGNVGTFGGAMALVAYSYLIIHAHTSLVFTNNQATVNGGVFYVDVQDEPEYVLFDCFLYLNSSDSYCFDSKTCSTSGIKELGILVTFLNNSAPLGSIIYGSALQSCPWGKALRMSDLNDTLNFWMYLTHNEKTDSIFHFDREPSGIDAVTTPSHNLRIERETHFSRSVMPGQKFEIEMTARDRLDQQVPIAVTSTVVSVDQPEGNFNTSHHMASSILGYSNYWGLTSDNTTNVTMRVMGKRSHSVTVSIFTTDSAVEANVQVHLLDCYPGFMIDPHENSSCVCIPELDNAGIECFDDSHELRIPHSLWVGPLSETDNHSLVVQRCILGYCQPGMKVIKVQSRRSFDEECANGYNRTGLLCGSCREGNSVVLGSRKCKVCSDNAFLALIIVFAVAGLLLIALVAFLKVSLSEGYLNGVLFHSHISSLYMVYLAPNASAVFLPVAFLNLDFGIETCFYSGMTALQYTGLQFVFPFYLYFLMGAIIFLGRFVKCPHSIGFSAGKTFATLLVISYISILRTCITILGLVTIQSITRPEDGSSVRWYVDPTIHYCHGWHVVLVCISLFLMIIYIIPLPLLLLFPSKAYQFKYTRKLKPILDAFFAPYKPKFRCWFGVRLLFSICTLAITLFLEYSRTAFMLIVLALIVFAYIQLVMRPYDGICRNASDSFLLVNNIVLLLGIVFFNERYSEYDTARTQYLHTTYSVVVVATAYIVYIAVLLYHVYLLKMLQHQEKMMPCLKRLKKPLKGYFEDGNGFTISSGEEDAHVSVYYRFDTGAKKCESVGVTSSTVDRPIEDQDDECV